MPQFDFQNGRGQTLRGRLELPADSAPQAVAIFAHCFACGKHSRAASRISRRLAQQGIAVFRFDFTGIGNSDGDFANTNFSSNIEDLVAANETFTSQYQPPVLLIGHSLGGAAALIAAEQMPHVRAVATIGSPSEPSIVEQLIGDKAEEIDVRGAATVTLGRQQFRLEKQFLDDIRQSRVIDAVKRSDKALLVCHSDADRVVPVEQGRAIFAAATGAKSFVSLGQADHMLVDRLESNFVADMLATWASQFIAPMQLEERAVERLPPRVVEVLASGGQLTQQIQTADHHWIADEPTSVGGSNLGPDPYALLLSSLGACTAMTLTMYANRKRWSIDRIRIRLRHSREHVEDCATCEVRDPKLDVIEKEIFVRGGLAPEQLSKLSEIADRCPVHRTLMNEKRIVSRIQQDQA